MSYSKTDSTRDIKIAYSSLVKAYSGIEHADLINLKVARTEALRLKEQTEHLISRISGKIGDR